MKSRRTSSRAADTPRERAAKAAPSGARTSVNDPVSVPLPSSLKRARPPSRERGRTRFQALLEATESLLRERSPDDIGLYQIAERADIAPASVYHFFPTKNAALLALAEKYHADFRIIVNEPIAVSRLISWQDLLVVRHERAVEYYNSHLPAAKIFLGIHPSWEIHQADKNYNRGASQALFEHFDRVFVMPYVKDPASKFEIMYSIADSIWAISFERHMRITPKYSEEATTACIAYCRTFLPERVARRPELPDAVVRDAHIAGN